MKRGGACQKPLKSGPGRAATAAAGPNLRLRVGSRSAATSQAGCSMATPRRFPTLVQLEQREGALFTVLGNLTKRPYWFHLEYLKSPKAVRLEAWLVEAIFGEWVPEGWPMRSFPLLSPVQALHWL